MSSWESKVDLPESSLGIAADASSGTLNTTLLGKGSWRAAFLARLLLHLLLGRSHALRRTLLLLHTVAVVFLRKLALLAGVVLERHVADTSLSDDAQRL